MRSNGCRRRRDRHRRRRSAGGDDEAASAPGVEDSEEAELGAEMLGSGGDGLQGFGGGVEQDVVDRCLVVMGDGGDLLRHGEDDVEVWHDQKF